MPPPRPGQRPQIRDGWRSLGAAAACGLALASAAPPRVLGQDASLPTAGSLLRPALPSGGQLPPSVKAPRKPIFPTKSTRQKPVEGVALAPTIAPAATPQGLGLVPVQKRAPPLAPPPPPPRRKPKPEDDPWAPIGFRSGGLVLKPAIQVDGGYDSNPNQFSGPHKGSSVVALGGAVDLASDWSRHSLTGAWRGALFRFPQDSSANRPDSEGRATLRLDVLRDTSVEIGASHVVTSQRPGSIEQPELSAKRSLIFTEGGSLGVEQRFGRFELKLKGALGRTDYQDVTLENGTLLSQADRNYDTHGVSLRASYEATPGVKPFVQGTWDERIYDQPIDAGGYARSSNGATATLGTTLEFSRLLTGDIAAGYGQRNYQDPRLAPLRGPVIDGSLIWTPTPLTTVKFRAATSLEETTVSNATGAVAQTVGVEIDHALRRNLTLSAAVVFTRTEYQGVSIREDQMNLAARLEYKLTRSVVLRASAVHQRLNSTVTGNDYTANVFLVGLRFQH
ncbi:MAG: outer membrane beta-barrel protein [Alsobacter sp.]